MLFKYFKILLLAISFSCFNQEQNPSKFQMDLSPKEEPLIRESRTDGITLSDNVDRIKIMAFFFGKHSNRSFTLFFSKDHFVVIFPHDSKKKTT